MSALRRVYRLCITCVFAASFLRYAASGLKPRKAAIFFGEEVVTNCDHLLTCGLSVRRSLEPGGGRGALKPVFLKRNHHPSGSTRGRY